MTHQTVANALKHTLPVVTSTVIAPGFSVTPVQRAVCFPFMYLGEVTLAWPRGRRKVDSGYGVAVVFSYHDCFWKIVVASKLTEPFTAARNISAQ